MTRVDAAKGSVREMAARACSQARGDLYRAAETLVKRQGRSGAD